LKTERLRQLKKYKNFSFYKGSICSKKFMQKIFISNNFTYVLNLAAQAGVRYSITNPYTYLNNNVSGFLNILEFSRKNLVKHLVYASSSSVYGLNIKKRPISTADPASHPLAIYGVTKRTNELMAHSFSSLYSLPTTGLRYFTVYGPWGRPDMALFKFVSSILKNKIIKLFNHGNHIRDFTYIDDVVELTYRAVLKIPKKSKTINEYSSLVPWKIYNICSSRPIHLKYFIKLISDKINKNVRFNNLKMQQGDVLKTHGDNKITLRELGYKPKFNIKKGISNFIEWYFKFYKIKNEKN